MPVTNFTSVPNILADIDKIVQKAGAPSYCPAYQKYSTTKKIMGAKSVWNKFTYSSMKDTLNANLTNSAADVTVTVVGSSTNNRIYYVAGSTYITIGRERMLVTAVNSATSLTVTRAWGGSIIAAHTSADPILVGYTNQVGVPQLGRDDTQYSVRSYNYFSNFQLEIPLDNMNKDGRYPRYTNENEASFEKQKADRELDVIKQIEFEFWNGFRYTEGDAAISTAGLTFTGQGGKNTTGGYSNFINLDGGISDDLSGAPISEARLRSQIRRLRLRGAFDSSTANSEAHGVKGYIYVPFEQGTMIQTIVDPFRNLSSEVISKFGTDVTVVDIEGVMLQVKRTIGLPTTSYAIMPERSGLCTINLQRFMERQADNVSGDRTTAIYENTWANKFGNLYMCLEAINCAVPSV